jgi:hypothetical protein
VSTQFSADRVAAMSTTQRLRNTMPMSDRRTVERRDASQTTVAREVMGRIGSTKMSSGEFWRSHVHALQGQGDPTCDIVWCCCFDMARSLGVSNAPPSRSQGHALTPQ